MASEQLANSSSNVKELIESYTAPKERLRHIQEIDARYKLRLNQYKELNISRSDNRDQRLMIYTEIKTLGWVLGKKEKAVIKDITEASKMVSPLGL